MKTRAPEQQNLFNASDGAETQKREPAAHQPLAERLRPRRLEQYVGQSDLVGPHSPLRKAIEKDQIHSFLLWGPPGSGKTTLARIIAEHTDSVFVAMSAVMAGVKDIKEVVEQARNTRRVLNRRTILFVDEIHRFNKSQQDALLPFVEDGTVILIGATTENPSFEVNSALLSRLAVYVLKPLQVDQIEIILTRALTDATLGLGAQQVSVPELWLKRMASMADGDARRGLGLLERVVDFVASDKTAEFSDEAFERALGHKAIRYDTKGEEHYNTISAFIKCMRDSDPDGALYYLARMLEGGEDPLFIARRMVIFASEDVGNADPRALQIALAVRDAVDFVGMPEARINLGHGVTYLAVAPKSNASYMGIEAALAEVRESGQLEIPLHIRNAPTKLMKGLGYGKGYRYAHEYDQQVTGMVNLPGAIAGKRFYEPKDVGLEAQIKAKLDILRKSRG